VCCSVLQCVTQDLKTNHVTYIDASCHIYECVMSHICMCHVIYMNESCHVYTQVMSRVYTSQVTYTNETCHSCHSDGWKRPRTIRNGVRSTHRSCLVLMRGGLASVTSLLSCRSLSLSRSLFLISVSLSLSGYTHTVIGASLLHARSLSDAQTSSWGLARTHARAHSLAVALSLSLSLSLSLTHTHTHAHS